MGAASGRLDALVFMAGVLAGVLVFAEVYGSLAGFVAFVWSGELGSVTLGDLLGLPFWVLATALALMAVATFWMLRKVERPEKEVRE